MDFKLRSYVKKIVGVFLFVNLVMPQTGGDNAASRFASSLALAMRGTLNIDHIEQITGDWSRTPDGHYYSNKAPLPAFLAVPIVWVALQINVPSHSSEDDTISIMTRHSSFLRSVISWLLQVIPMAWLIFYLVETLIQARMSHQGIKWTLLCILFGSTASVYLNNYFGHGMASFFVLLSFVLGINKKIVWSAFAFGCAQLSDYGCAFLLPGFLILWSTEVRGSSVLPTFRRIAIKILAGAALPVAFWCWYHVICFGSILALPNKFQNPQWVDIPASESALWGIFRQYPRPDILFELLFGTARGLFFTQPWMLLIYGWSVFEIWHRWRRSALVSDGFIAGMVAWTIFLGLSGLLLMNASFGGWHGGAANGPRYLTPVMFICALGVGFSWEQFSERWQLILKWTIVFAVIYFALGFSQTLLSDMNPWHEYLTVPFKRPGIRLVRMVICAVLFRFVIKSPI